MAHEDRIVIFELPIAKVEVVVTTVTTTVTFVLELEED